MDWFQNIWSKIPAWIKNRYVFSTAVLLVILLFIDGNTLFRLVNRKQRLNELNRQELYLKKEIETLKEEKRAFEQDKEALEKFAREEYYMKKDSEDLFIFVEDEK